MQSHGDHHHSAARCGGGSAGAVKNDVLRLEKYKNCRNIRHDRSRNDDKPCQEKSTISEGTILSIENVKPIKIELAMPNSSRLFLLASQRR